MTLDTRNESDTNERNRIIGQREAQLDRDIKKVLQTKAGRNFTWWVMDHLAGIMRSSLVGSTNDIIASEGGRSVGLKLMDRIQQVAPERYTQALTEELKERARLKKWAREPQGDNEDATGSED